MKQIITKDKKVYCVTEVPYPAEVIKGMKKCKYCVYREGCIGEIPGPDGKCMGFAVPPELQQAYQAFLEEEKKNDFAALCREG